MSLIGQDIVIVDTKSDLNAYIDVGLEGKQENEDVAGCCGSSAIQAASKASSKASIIEHAEAACCSQLHPETCTGTAASWSIADININEWAGKFHCS